MARPVMRNDEWVGMLIEPEDRAPYLVPAVVIDDASGAVLLGLEVLEAVVLSGTAIEHPIIRTSDPGYVAELEQFLAGVKTTLNVDGLIL